MPSHCSPLRLELRSAFNLAHGSSDSRVNALATIRDGIGETAVVPYYGMTYESAAAEIERAAGALTAGADLDGSIVEIEELLDRLESLGTSASAKCAIDLALHDLIGKRLGLPLHRYFGIELPKREMLTSFTIAIDAPEAVARKAREAGLPILKIKLGGPDADEDLEIVRRVREATSARLRLDSNAGWDRETAARLIPRLMEYDIELFEQPLPKEDREGYAWLRSRVKAPIFADESFQTDADLVALAPNIEGVVIKLMKSGGLRGAIRQIELARAHGLKTMLSCMIESSLAVTAAAQLGPLADYLDLDGPLLIANDPFIGIRYDGARISLPSSPGIGATPR